jgi:hypothetical protein
MARRVYRVFVIVGARPKTFEMTGPPLHVEADRVGVGPQAQHTVDVWYEHDDDAQPVQRELVAVGTGHPLPDGALYRGSTARTEDGFVWHLYELPATNPPE